METTRSIGTKPKEQKNIGNSSTLCQELPVAACRRLCSLPPMAPVAASSMDVPVFIETNLGSRVALSAPPDITAADFKRTLVREYFGCFPESGPVRVHALMVKRRSCFYHLPDTLPIKRVFHGAAKAWFLHVDLRPSDDSSKPCLRDHIATEEHRRASGSSFTSTEDRKGEILVKSLEPCPLKRQRNALHLTEEKGNSSLLECRDLIRNEENERNDPVVAERLREPVNTGNNNQADETSTGTPSEAISVGGIIKRYFCSDELTNCVTSPVTDSRAVQSRPKERTNALVDFAVKTPPRPLNSPRDSSERSRVGKRLVTASYVLGVSPTQKNVSSLCRSKDGNGKPSRCSPVTKYPVFEMSDSSDRQSNT